MQELLLSRSEFNVCYMLFLVYMCIICMNKLLMSCGQGDAKLKQCMSCWYVTRLDYNNMAVSLSDPEHLITPPYRHVSSSRTPRGSTYSAGGDVNHQSITPENAANAAPPPAIAMGPEFLANIAPVTNPPDTAFVMSCFARYYTSVIVRAFDMRMTYTLNTAFDTGV